MNNNIELLDFCRIKKIFDKGFGFLSSIHFEENIFFHFSKIRDKEVKETLQNMKRGVVYVFFTSKKVEGKRKVSRLWTDINKVDTRLIPPFVKNVINELEYGTTNLFETAHVIKLLREKNYLTKSNLKEILQLPVITRTPTIIKPMLNEDELEKISNFEKLINDIKNSKIRKEDLVNLILNKITES